MNVASFGFLLLVLVGSAFFFALPRGAARRAVLTILNAIFLWTLVPDLTTAGVLAAFLLSGFVAARVAMRWSSRWVLPGYLIALVAAFLVLKRYAFVAFALPAALQTHTVVIVGLSYMLFRQIHFVVDAAQGQLAKPSLWAYLNYQLNLFGILSGPIQRYDSYATYWSDPVPMHRDQPALLRAYGRLFVGLFQLMVLGELCIELYQTAVAQTGWHPLGRSLAIFYSYPAYVYLNFAGYCSIVIAAASLFGMTMPENFDRPYVARNMIDYWNRWHISLSHWIRDYIFTPLYKALVMRWSKGATAFGPLCFFVAFLIAGVWHGSTLNFVYFGVANGIGVSLAKMWENRLVKKRGRKGFKEYLKSKPVHAVATVVTFHYACASIQFFPPDLAGLRAILGYLSS